jgi:hypothetical protein
MSALPYSIDPNDPRAPPLEVWDRLSAEERAAVVASLPSEFPVSEQAVPEGDPHYEAKSRTRETLRGYFSRIGRKVYLACELPVYYPGEPMFAPDVMAVVEVETHPRMSWVVSHEKKGLDLALEVHVSGDWRKDLQRNVEHYARLGIQEYWVFDRKHLRLSGWRLGEDGRYRQRVPQHGFYQSEVLGLELQVEDERLRFYMGRAPLPEADEMIATLEQMVERVEARSAELEQHLAEEQRLRAEEQQRREEEQQRREEAERRLAEALAELERLRGGQS